MSSRINLLVRSGPDAGKQFGVERFPACIGSGDEADIRLSDPLVSPRHCHLRIQTSWCIVEDAGSENGTFLDGRLISKSAVFPGEVLLLGNSRIVIEVPDDITLEGWVKRHGEWVQIPRIIAHELKNYLQFLDLGFGHLTADPMVGEKFHRDIRTVTMAKNRIEELVQVLRTGGSPPKFKPILLADVLWEQLMLFEPMAQENNIRLEFDIPVRQLVLFADKEQLGRCVMNFMKNAVEACSTGDVVSLRCLVREQTLRIEISDTGPGMPPDVLESFWTPLFTTKPNGNGLGTFIARTIILRHGGHVTVHSTPNAGTKIAIDLPIWEFRE